MDSIIELHDVENLGTGAIGEPGSREFFVQARNSAMQLTVLVEKQQVALLATEVISFLDRIAEEHPEDTLALPIEEARLREPTVPLFRARLIGLGFDTDLGLVLIELREHVAEDGDSERLTTETELGSEHEEDGYVARIYATRAQVRALAARGVTEVEGGRPECSLCSMPMDPGGHRCPRWN
ncbi:MAG: DUF3090 family protein [Actinobacteria bacterium]|jgi:uncharacterized repeat protein (TIGR03847 family)|nr:DUF3090 family protein [Actinomycetota bacterium]